MADSNKFPAWCKTCAIRKPKDICDYCKMEFNPTKEIVMPNGYKSDEEEREGNLIMLHESNALNM